MSGDQLDLDACPECGGNIIADMLESEIVCTDCGWRG